MPSDLLPGVTGVLVLADGTVLQGIGCGAEGEAVGEVCFNTAMSGYQEILTDPSYMAQIVAFTFPHIGNVGTNAEDLEQRGGTAETAARGAIFRDVPTEEANWRANSDLDGWLKRRGVVALAGVDTRALTKSIRERGMPHGVIAHRADGKFDIGALVAKAMAWAGLEGMDLAKDASCTQTYVWRDGLWAWPDGYEAAAATPRYEVVVVDYGVKRNILRALTSIGARATVVPASTTADEILARRPDGVLLSNGPGDPAATGIYAVPEIRKLTDSGKPVFGICLGHQLLALALGARTTKMEQGHHGANHPVKDLTTGKVEIVSMNHGFTVDRASLPAAVKETHVSLFDGTNAGLAVEGRPIFSVQHHPEASPGPKDSLYLFDRFAGMMDKAKAAA
jgi:carbamoyl-phosphate synthase small subunit